MEDKPQEHGSGSQRKSSSSSSCSTSSTGYFSSSASVEPEPSQSQESKDLDNKLLDAVRSGDLSTTQQVLSAGAPIHRHTPLDILSAPPAQQIPLFELFTRHGWTPNTPIYYGDVLLLHIVTNRPLLKWFLEHGADPNLGKQPNHWDRMGPSVTSGAALTQAARAGDLEAVRLLLDAGARPQNGDLLVGTPLHAAAGACPPGTWSGAKLNEGVYPSREFDESQIPIMALLVEHGADVNAAEDRRLVLAQYPIVHAAMAGAVERVKWLLSHGADPNIKGDFGNAVEYAKWRGSTEMKRVLGIPVDDERALE